MIKVKSHFYCDNFYVDCEKKYYSQKIFIIDKMHFGAKTGKNKNSLSHVTL